MNTRAPSIRYGTQYANRRPGNFTGAVIAVVLHGAAVAVLLHYEPVRTALTGVAPLMVRLITPVVEKPEVLPRPLPVRPKTQPRPVVPQRIITAVVEAPSPYVAPPALPAPPVETPMAIAVPPNAPAAVAAQKPVVPPSFNASYLQNPPPTYPGLARRLGQHGKVMLRVLVSTAGAADQVELRSSSGYNSLDQAALDAVKRWRFVSARRDDQPVAAWVLVPITFTLED